MAASRPGTAPGADGTPARVDAVEDWPARISAALFADAPARVALVGERAAALLGGSETTPGAGDGDADVAGTDAGTDGRGGGPVHAGPGGRPAGARRSRFDSIDECARVAPERRQAEAALLVPDTLVGLERTLGTACRLYPSRLLLFVDGVNVPAPERLFAFGFRRLAAGAGGELHEYRLRDYKPSPEWLNARFWANPERFGKDGEDGENGEDELDASGADPFDETDVDAADELDESDADGTTGFDRSGAGR